MRPLLVELAGPAGAGKTTLARALIAADLQQTSIGIGVGRLALAAGIVTMAPPLAAARLSGPGRWWTRDELRSLAYLSSWRGAVAGPSTHGLDLILLDHGPVFRLASLAAFGPPMRGSRPFEELWSGLARDWGRLLDVVVWLDAPDSVLLRRIAGRAQEHRIRGVDDTDAARFLDRYRSAYRTTLARVTLGGARLVELDSMACPPDRLAATVIEAIRAHRSEART